MLEVIVLVLLLAAALVPGWLLLQLLQGSNPAAADSPAEDWLGWGFAALTLGLILLGWTAVVLAEIGWFSIAALILIWLTAVLALGLIAKQKNRPLTPSPHHLTTPSKWQLPLLLLWLIAASWLFLRPHQFVTGAGDAGVYVNLGASISRTGSIVIQDEGLAGLDASLQDVILRPLQNSNAASYLLPAFYVVDPAVGAIMPQFYPQHPVWYAMAYSLGGVQAELLLTGVWALLACLAIYLFVRLISRWQIAFLTIVVLSLNGMQVWFARYPTSETLTQYLLWTGLWATAVWLSDRSDARIWALLAGASLGVLFLVRIDLLFIVPVLALFLVWQWRRKQPAWLWFALPLLFLISHSLLHAISQSRPYFMDLYQYAVLSLLRGQTGLLLVLAGGVLALALFAYFFESITRLLNRYRRPLLATIIAGLLGLAVYGWFIRPLATEVTAYLDQFSGQNFINYNHENLRRLGWYLSPLGVWLGVLGICLLLWRMTWQTAVMLMITLFFTLFFNWNIRNNPAQIYAMRRFLPAVLPLFTLAAATLIGALYERRPPTAARLPFAPYVWRVTAVALATLWLGSTIWSARGFVSQVDYAGLPEQIAQFSAQLEPNAILLWHDQRPINPGDHLGTPLKFQYEHEIYILRNLEALEDEILVRQIEKWQNSGRSIYWVGDPAWLNAQQLPYSATRFEFNTQFLEQTADHKPTAVLPLRWVVELAKLEE